MLAHLKTVGILEEAPEFWCLGTRTLVPLYFWIWISCWWTLFHAGSVILRTGNVKNLYLNLGRRQILISRAFYWLEIWNLLALSEGHHNSGARAFLDGLSWKYVSKQLIMLRFYHEAFALTPKLWCRHISFYFFDGWGGGIPDICHFFYTGKIFGE